MMKFSYLMLVFLCSSYTYADALEPSCSGKEIVAGFNDWVSDITEYNIKTNVSLTKSNAIIKAQAQGKTGALLRINLTLQDHGTTLIHQQIFDGVYQWVESKYEDTYEVQKIRLEKTTEPERPFDTNYYLWGTGLFSGEDFPSTLKVILKLYDLNKNNCLDDGGFTLSGDITEENLKKYFVERKSSDSRTLKKFLTGFKHIEIRLDRHYNIVSYSIGKSQKEPVLSVSFYDMVINKPVSSAVFSYSPPKGVKVLDITEQVN